jgi:hypothetical protein
LGSAAKVVMVDIATVDPSSQLSGMALSIVVAEDQPVIKKLRAGCWRGAGTGKPLFFNGRGAIEAIEGGSSI